MTVSRTALLAAAALALLASHAGCVTGDDNIVRPVEPAEVAYGAGDAYVGGEYHLGGSGGLLIWVPPHEGEGEVLTAIEFDALVFDGDLITYGYNYIPPNIHNVVAERQPAASGHVVRTFDCEPGLIAIMPQGVTTTATISGIRLLFRYTD